MKHLSRFTIILTSVVLAGFACFEGFVIWRIQNRNSEGWEIFALAGIVLFLSTMFFMACMWLHYLEIRWLYIPCWRWMASGCKGEPKLPFPRFSWATKSARAEAKSKMNKKQRACIWFGNTCSGLGAILLLIAVLWRLVLTITGEETIGSTANILFGIGIFIFFAGICVSGLVYQRILKTGDPSRK